MTAFMLNFHLDPPDLFSLFALFLNSIREPLCCKALVTNVAHYPLLPLPCVAFRSALVWFLLEIKSHVFFSFSFSFFGSLRDRKSVV